MIEAISPQPTVGQVGLTVTLSVTGTPVGDPRWFVRAKPLGSTQALNTRLDGSLATTFTPDVAGAYTLAVKDVTVTIPVPPFDGAPTQAPYDDEATAPEATLVYWVAETISRPINAGKGQATLSLSTYADQADETRTTLVTLVPTAPVVIGVDTLADPYLAGVLTELRTALSLSTFLGPSLAFLDDLWRGLYRHVSTATVVVHGTPDASTTPSGAPADLAGCQALLAALAADLVTHENNTTSHGSVAYPTPLATPIGTTLAEACAYAAALDRALVWHATALLVTPGDAAQVHGSEIADPYEGRWREPPYDLATLCAFAVELSARLAAHKARGDLSFHHNLLTAPSVASPFFAGMASRDATNAIGQMADVFSEHVTSYAGFPVVVSQGGAHLAKRPAPGILRPTDAKTAGLAAESLVLAMEAHMLDLAAHNGRPAIGASRVRAGSDPETMRWPYTARLSKRLETLLSSTAPPVPENRNSAATLWRVFGGWTLPMTTTSATFEFSTDGGATWKPADAPLTGSLALALSGSPIVVRARLSSLAGVHTVVWSTPTADELTIDGGYAGVTVVQASDKSVTLTVPGTGGRSYVLQAAVNGVATLVRRLAVHVKTSNSLEVIAAGEYDEANRTYGWTGGLNAAIRAIAAGGGGGASPSVTTPTAVAAAGAVGVATEYARGDHAHAGVTSYNGAQGAVTGVSTVGGATPSAGAISISGGGTSGIVVAPSGNDVALRVGWTGQAAGDLVKATSGTAVARVALGGADKLLGVNGAGTDVAYTDTPWLVGAHFGAGGSVANVTFGTAPAQAIGDATNGQAFGIRSDATLNKGLVSFFDDAGAQKADLESDDGNSIVTLRGRAQGVRITTAANDSKIGVYCEASTQNVGLSGETAFNGMVDGVGFGLGTTAPTSVPANKTYAITMTTGFRVYNASAFSSYIGLTERLKVVGASVAVNTSLAVGTLTGSFGGGSNVMFMVNGTAPSSNPTGGGIHYVEGGAAKFRGSGGTITTYGPS